MFREFIFTRVPNITKLDMNIQKYYDLSDISIVFSFTTHFIYIGETKVNSRNIVLVIDISSVDMS